MRAAIERLIADCESYIILTKVKAVGPPALPDRLDPTLCLGYVPTAIFPPCRMRATFMIMGWGVPKNRSLGEIDMRSIAPTVATILGVALPEAELAPLSQITRPN